MRHYFTAAVLAAATVLPAFADDPKKDDKPAADAYVKAGAETGKLVEVNESAKSIKVEVTTDVTKPNNNEIRALADCQNQLQQAIARRDRNAAINLEQQIAQHSAHLQTVEHKTTKMEFAGTDDVQVRRESPPPLYDDKGNLRKPTDKELKDLKGDPKLPGYQAEFTDLKQGDYVKVTLVKKKPTAEEKPKPGDPPPEKTDNPPLASIIEIVAAPKATK